MKIRVTYRDRELKQAIRYASMRGLERGAVFFHTKLRQEVSKSAGPKTVVGRGGKKRTVYTRPSKPGEFPRLRTGTGRDNTVWETNRNIHRPKTRVGVRVNALYMHWLETPMARLYLLGGLRKYVRVIADQIRAQSQAEMRRRAR